MPVRALLRSLILVAIGSLMAAQSPTVRWEPLASGVSVRLRGIHAVSSRVAWASGERGTVLRTTDGGQSWHARQVAGAEALDLRDIHAWSDTTAVAMSAGPGEASRIYRTEDGGTTWSLRYTATDAGMFLDALAFADQARGVAVSDAVAGRLVVLTTADGGRTWTRVPADRLPPAVDGEGAFAASGTNVVVRGRRVWIATNASRVLRSADGGRTWAVAPTPVPTGQAAGIFSIAMRDDRHGLVVGGVYTREREAVDNAAVTTDGGASWRLAPGLSGYRSVVAPWSRLGPRAWLAIGPSGADVSLDDGATWAPAGGDGYDAFSLAPDGSVGFATGAAGRIARVTAPGM
ncbi:oxidoreductase [Luteitalea sp. TBR-22]|uniref:WD40/YVTN/BNR-like repeat-containing protein n=1 Tax=Luteitalea sp. TBR-22 TaxID=2802971 RepID=UPI001AF589FB|nr:YCF48-related protein [Luteitalea sp. TBR-22]BCS32035.1 oxidoreductase [Luteitalea sp. TBR-22]